MEQTSVDFGSAEAMGSQPTARSTIGSTTTVSQPATRPALDDLLSVVLDKPVAPRQVDDSKPVASDLVQRFLHSQHLGESLLAWGELCGLDVRTVGAEKIRQRLQIDIAKIDALVSEQVNAIIHHPRFQKLEASWRGLHYLVKQVEDPEADQVKVRVLQWSWSELVKDLDAIEFDRSEIFRKVYTNEFDMPGGEPFGLLIGDYEVWPFPSPQHRHDDVSTLALMAEVAAAAFSPFITACSPQMFGLTRFDDLQRVEQLGGGFEQLDYLKWRALRDSEDARFLGLTLPRALMRLPYDNPATTAGFVFNEDVSGNDSSKRLWGNSAYVYGGVVIRAFRNSAWLADTLGIRHGVEGGGLVTDLPRVSCPTDRAGVVPRLVTEVVVAEDQEAELAELGFLPLSACHDTGDAAFLSAHSVQRPKRYDNPSATANAHLSSLLHYVLCTSRFSHYVKVLARNKVGQFTDAQACEQFLQRWVTQYVTLDSDASPRVLAERPLRDAQVQVREHPRKPGAFQCIFHLSPHYQLERLVAQIKFTTNLAK